MYFGTGFSRLAIFNEACSFHHHQPSTHEAFAGFHGTCNPCYNVLNHAADISLLQYVIARRPMYHCLSSSFTYIITVFQHK